MGFRVRVRFMNGLKKIAKNANMGGYREHYDVRCRFLWNYRPTSKMRNQQMVLWLEQF